MGAKIFQGRKRKFSREGKKKRKKEKEKEKENVGLWRSKEELSGMIITITSCTIFQPSKFVY